MEIEIWKEIDGFPGYEVSNQGGVRSWWKSGPGGRVARTKAYVMRQGANKSGRLHVTLRNPPIKETQDTHVLVARSFLGVQPVNTQVAHNDGNHLNNDASNLRWATPKENAADRKLHGTEHQAKGELNGMSKLTEGDVIEIRYLRSEGIKPVELAELYGVGKNHISRVVSGSRWRHV